MQIVREGEQGTEVRCPNCGNWALIEDYRSFTLNPHYVTELTPVLQCHNEASDARLGETRRLPCMHIFAPTTLALQMRQKLLAGVKEE